MAQHTGIRRLDFFKCEIHIEIFLSNLIFQDIMDKMGQFLYLVSDFPLIYAVLDLPVLHSMY